MMRLTKRAAYVFGVLALVLLAGRPANAQRARGELRIEVHDPLLSISLWHTIELVL
jgi:hypothetical protein